MNNLINNQPTESNLDPSNPSGNFNSDKKPVILKLDEFFSRGKKCHSFKKAIEEIRNDREEYDKIRFKRNKDWSELSNKIIGCE